MAIKLSEFIKISKELIDFNRCVTLVTKYKENVFNYRHYSQELIEIEKKMKSKNIIDMFLNKTIDIYFDGNNAAEAIEKAIVEIKEVTGHDTREEIKKIF